MISTESTPRTSSSPERSDTYRNGQTIGALLKSLRNDLVVLVRQEIALARGEIMDAARRISKDVVMIAVGGAIALAGAIVLLMGLASGAAVALAAAGLNPEIAVWLGPLLLGLVVVAIGFGILQTARHRLKRTSLMPKRTVQTIKEDSTWAKEKLQRS